MTAKGARAEADFLERLLQRSSEEGGALQPRLPGLFEPVAPAATVAELGAEQGALVASATPPVPNESVVPPLRRTARALGDEVEPAFAPAVGSSLASVKLPAAVPEQASRSPWAPPAPRIPVRSGEQVGPATASVSRAKARAEAPALELHTEHEVPAVVATAPRANEPRRAASEGGLPAALAMPPRQSLLAAPPAVVRSIAALSKSFEQPPRRESSTINVSIGRLEVKATQPRKPAAGPARSSAVGPLSLDDYLKQTGGRR